MRDFVTIESTRFPLVAAKFADFIPTMEEFLDMQAKLTKFVQTHTDFVLIVDMSQMQFMPSEHRIAQANWQKQSNPLFLKQRMSLAFCTPSIIAQMMLKGVLIINKPSVPYTVVSSIDKATEWATAELKRKGRS
jgi:hypothetical protein